MLANRHPSTLRSWTRGDRPIIRASGKHPTLLSFFNLVEAHLIDGIKRDHGVSLQKIRRAVEYIRSTFPSVPHPLLEQRLETDGLDLFIPFYGSLIAKRGRRDDKWLRCNGSYIALLTCLLLK